jgi:hypothetical protein
VAEVIPGVARAKAEIVVRLVAPGLNQLVVVLHLVVVGRVNQLVAALQIVIVAAATLFLWLVLLELVGMLATMVVEGEEVITAVVEVVMVVVVEEDQVIVLIFTAAT